MECASCNESDRSVEYDLDWNSTDVYDENQFVQAVWQQVLWTLAFTIIVLVAAGGNIVVIWVVLEDRRMRTVTNYFLVNLSVADVMVSTANVIFNFIYMLNTDWPFGHALCKITNFSSVLSIAASVFTLVAISVDRYIAIMSPLKPRMSRMTTITIVLCIWILSALLSLPNLLFTTTKTEYYLSGQSRRVCFTQWPDGPMTQSNQEYM
uniref:G-protein coupled receptors family 1 profile domain-containing protein n=1 Tax=Strigamia maritima TaxID=126957 RepID=T1IKZ7_STRMM